MVVTGKIIGLDEIEKKTNRLNEIIEEAKTLAEELASMDVDISFDVNGC